MFNPVITTNLSIRPMELNDAEQVFRYRSMPEISKYQNWEPKATEEIVLYIQKMKSVEFLTPGQWFQFSIMLQQTKNIIGDIGIHCYHDRRQVEIGITIDPAFQRQGLAFEAVEAAIEYMFSQTETHRISASIDPRNDPSLGLFRKLGFRQEAHFRESVWFKGEWADDMVFGLLKSEWTQ